MARGKGGKQGQRCLPPMRHNACENLDRQLAVGAFLDQVRQFLIEQVRAGGRRARIAIAQNGCSLGGKGKGNASVPASTERRERLNVMDSPPCWLLF
jgi:hypothetical protein